VIEEIRAVAFDMDGLLINTEDLYEDVGKILLSRRGKVYREDVRQKMIGLPAPEAFGVIIEAENLQESWQDLQRETDEIFEEILEERLMLMAGVESLLDRIEAKGLPKCVATSSTKSFAQKALKQVGLYDRFEFVLTAAEVGKGKPHPDIYQEAARKLEVHVGNMLVLEDSENGTKAGVAATAYVVSVPNRHTKQGNFKGCKFVADSLLDERLLQLFL
jgi:HAD superfamily hydrolase (TIGR01509 family)